MAVERKCLNCGKWNGDEDHCISCGALLSPELIEEKREEERVQRRYRPPDRFDHFIHAWKHSRFFALKGLYYVLYTIGFIFFSVAAFFAWLAASPNG